MTDEPTDPRLAFKIDERRHIVQLTAGQTTVFALCDDGSVWERTARWPGRWDRLPEIPQEEDR